MSCTSWPSIPEIKDLFTEGIAAAGGTVSDVFEDTARLFARSILPDIREVQPGDRVQGGVALRATDRDICVHPYVFRQVCTNGAIIAQALQTKRIRCHDFKEAPESTAEVLEGVRESVRACCSDEAFSTTVLEMRSALETEADVVLQLMPMVARLPQHLATQIMADVFERFEAAKDRSRFGLVNAVTSLARDTREPEMRWRLEKIGGGMLAKLKPAPAPKKAGTEAVMVA
jgi:hypothetical protein